MTAYMFLSVLPAVLGLAGFVAYLLIGQSRIGGDLVKGIADKLRKEPNVDIAKYGPLTPARLEKLLNQDASIRSAVNDQDIRLLHSIVVLQYVVTIIVVVLSAALVVWSCWLMTRPRPLSVAPSAPKAVLPEADGMLVDLDPIAVQWISTGKDELISVSLENVDTRTRTPRRQVNSNVKSVEFTADEVMKMAANRDYRGKNRIRAVVEWPGDTAVSDTVELRVGITVQLHLFGRLLAHDGPERTIHTLIATIDNSTERMPQNYCFTVNFVYTLDTGPAVAPLRSCQSDGEIVIAGIERVRWDRPYGLVYTGPDDPKVVRWVVLNAPNK